MRRRNASQEEIPRCARDDARPIRALFISDLHLHPESKAITTRFFQLLDWATEQTDTLYILGDFFHAWSGDDALDDWARSIAARLAQLPEQGVTCYFMPGNRDFLLGEGFASVAKWIPLPDPARVQLDGETILLSHGDRYCTADRAHQWFRRLTRNKAFRTLFSWIPLSLRQQWVQQVRAYSSSNNRKKLTYKMEVVESTVMKALNKAKATTLIHGHTHVPQKVHYTVSKKKYTRYVLSDWDDSPTVLCYYKSHGFKLVPFNKLLQGIDHAS